MRSGESNDNSQLFMGKAREHECFAVFSSYKSQAMHLRLQNLGSSPHTYPLLGGPPWSSVICVWEGASTLFGISLSSST